MGERIALVPCINPAHQDSTPSMAVYDHGQAKLQVFCFGCKYHGWVTPDQVVMPPLSPSWHSGSGIANVYQGEYTPEITIKKYIEEFFKERNIDPAPWGVIEYGNKLKNKQIRPAFWYKLYNYDQQVIGEQIRFLDDLKPKVSLENTCGEYPKYAWIKGCYHYIQVVESWVDAAYINQQHCHDTLILLGTNPQCVNWYNLKGLLNGRSVRIYCDGDSAGIECANKIVKTLQSIGVCACDFTRVGKKVYEC